MHIIVAGTWVMQGRRKPRGKESSAERFNSKVSSPENTLPGGVDVGDRTGVSGETRVGGCSTFLELLIR